MTAVLERPIAFDSVLATVTTVQDLSPSLRRITFTAPRIAESVVAGPDQRIKLLLEPPSGAGLVLPSGAAWYADWLKQPEPDRFVMRTYTVRALRPESAESWTSSSSCTASPDRPRPGPATRRRATPSGC